MSSPAQPKPAGADDERFNAVLNSVLGSPRGGRGPQGGLAAPAAAPLGAGFQPPGVSHGPRAPGLIAGGPPGGFALQRIQEDDIPPSGEMDHDSVQEVALTISSAVGQHFGPLVKRLRTRIHEYESKVDAARKIHRKLEMDKEMLETKIEDMKVEREDLKERAASAVSRAGQGGGGGKSYALMGGGKAKTRALGDKMGGQDMGFEMDMTGVDRDTGKLDLSMQQGRWERIQAHVSRVLAKSVPLGRDLRFVRSVYGRACGNFFVFKRFLIFLNVVAMLLYLPLIIGYMMNKGVGSLSTPMCKTPLVGMPCVAFFGGYHRLTSGSRDPTLAAQYIGATVLFATAMLFLSLARWVHWDVLRQAERLEEELRPKKWSKVVLAAWDFRLASEEDRQNWSGSIRNRLESLRREDREDEMRRNRTPRDKWILRSKRFFGLFLNSILIMAAWVAVLFFSMSKKEISSSLELVLGSFGLGSVGSQVGDLAPNLVVSAIGGILPAATKAITSLEARPPANMAQHNLWRLYLGKILNAFIVVILNVELLVGTPMFGASQVLLPRDAENYPCVEDQTAATLFGLVITEFIIGMMLKPVTAAATANVKFQAMSKIKKDTNFDYPEFDIPDFAVDQIYFQVLLWTNILIMPPMVILAPLFMGLHFKWSLMALTRLTSRPFVDETSKLSVTFVQLLCVSASLVAALAYFLVLKPLPHESACGPFDHMIVPFQMVARLDFPGMSTAKLIVWIIYDNPGAIFVLSVMFGVLMMLRGRGALGAHRMALGTLQQDTGRQVEALEAEMWRMERGTELLKKRLEWFEKDKKG